MMVLSAAYAACRGIFGRIGIREVIIGDLIGYGRNGGTNWTIYSVEVSSHAVFSVISKSAIYYIKQHK